MLDIAQNPFSEPIKNFLKELKATKWAFPYILQIFHAIISGFLLIILGIMYITVGVLSQISNSFWDLITGLGQKMSFSNPIESSFYAISATVYFIIFLPFFILQSPIWLGGWFASKIGLKPLIIIVFTILLSIGIYFFRPQLPKEAISQILKIQDSVKKEYFSSDSTTTTNAQIEILAKDNVK